MDSLNGLGSFQYKALGFIVKESGEVGSINLLACFPELMDNPLYSIVPAVITFFQKPDIKLLLDSIQLAQLFSKILYFLLNLLNQFFVIHLFLSELVDI